MIVKKNVLVTIDEKLYDSFKSIVEREGGSISKYVKNFMTEKVFDNKSFIDEVFGDDHLKGLDKLRYRKG